LLTYASCKQSNTVNYQNTNFIQDTLKPISKLNQADTSELELLLLNFDLVNVNTLDSSIRVVLHYSTSQNFLNKPIYTNLTNAYFPCEVAIKVANAQYYLKEEYPNYSLIIFDAVRPLHIQQKMWDELDIPISQKSKYLAHPLDISLHNYGAAVDIGIIGNNNLLLDMGTPFDFFGELSEPKYEAKLLEEGKLTQQHVFNRKLLRKVMLQAGFLPITSEWWHFNAYSKIEAAKKFTLIK